MSRTIELVAGLMLLVIGALVLASGWIADWIGSLSVGDRWLAYWPALLIVLSAFFIGPALIGRRQHRAVAWRDFSTVFQLVFRSRAA